MGTKIIEQGSTAGGIAKVQYLDESGNVLYEVNDGDKIFKIVNGKISGLAGTGNRIVMVGAEGLLYSKDYQQAQTGYNSPAGATSIEIGAVNNDCVNGTRPYKWRQYIEGNASVGQNIFFQCYKNGGSAWENVAWMTSNGFGVIGLAGTGNRAVYSDSNGFLTNSSSDERVKKNVFNLSNSIDVLNSLKQIRGVTYNWNTEVEGYEAMGTQQEIGVIAQEIEQYIPQVVGENSTGYKSVDYAKLTAYLIEVNKALLERVELLESKVV